MANKTFRKSKFKALVIWSTCVLSISTVIVDSSKKKKRGIVNGHGYIYSFDYAEFVREGYAKTSSKTADSSTSFVVKVTDNMYATLKKAFGEEKAVELMACIFRNVKWADAFTYSDKKLTDKMKAAIDLILQTTSNDLDKKKYPRQSLLVSRDTYLLGVK